LKRASRNIPARTLSLHR